MVMSTMGPRTCVGKGLQELCGLTLFIHTLTLKMAACSSETLVSTYMITWHNNPDEDNHYSYSDLLLCLILSFLL